MVLREALSNHERIAHAMNAVAEHIWLRLALLSGRGAAKIEKWDVDVTAIVR